MAATLPPPPPPISGFGRGLSISLQALSPKAPTDKSLPQSESLSSAE